MHDGGGYRCLREALPPPPPEYGGLVDISSSCRGKKTGSCELRRSGRSAEERGGEKQKKDGHGMSLGRDERGGRGRGRGRGMG